MTENLYGDVNKPDAPDAPAPKRKRKSTPKKKIDGNLLRVQAMGSSIEIVSPIPRDKFVEEMVAAEKVPAQKFEDYKLQRVN